LSVWSTTIGTSGSSSSNNRLQIAEEPSRTYRVHLYIVSCQTRLPQRIAGHDLFPVPGDDEEYRQRLAVLAERLQTPNRAPDERM
jgi:hypothetical protein